MRELALNYEILTDISEGGEKELKSIENAARTCYKSQAQNDNFETTKSFIRRLISSGHTAMLEHSFLSIKFISDRGFTHELVRHRHFSYAQESTRYCNYNNDKFDNEISVIPLSEYTDFDNRFINLPKDKQRYILSIWKESMQHSENAYKSMVSLGCSPQLARAVLPNSLKTEIVVTGNYREWIHYFGLRCAPDAHPIMRAQNIPLVLELNERIPVIFEEIVDKYRLEDYYNTAQDSDDFV